jgi:hypothetical protein
MAESENNRQSFSQDSKYLLLSLTSMLPYRPETMELRYTQNQKQASLYLPG